MDVMLLPEAQVGMLPSRVARNTTPLLSVEVGVTVNAALKTWLDVTPEIDVGAVLSMFAVAESVDAAALPELLVALPARIEIPIVPSPVPAVTLT